MLVWDMPGVDLSNPVLWVKDLKDGYCKRTSCQMYINTKPAKIRGAAIWQQMDGISVAANANTTTRHMASTVAGPRRSTAIVVGVCTCSLCTSELWRV